MESADAEDESELELEALADPPLRKRIACLIEMYHRKDVRQNTEEQ
jgi:hypothetical protein